MPWPLHPQESDPVPSIQEATWAPGPGMYNIRSILMKKVKEIMGGSMSKFLR